MVASDADGRLRPPSSVRLQAADRLLPKFPERLVLFDAAEPLTIKDPPSAAFHTIGA